MVFEDEGKMMFITDKSLYCYKVISFSLKNVGAIYQRLVNKIFKNQIDRNIEVYVDDILMKSKKATLHIDDLAKAFDVLRRYQMKLNLTKYASSITTEKFLSFKMTR